MSADSVCQSLQRSSSAKGGRRRLVPLLLQRNPTGHTPQGLPRKLKLPFPPITAAAATGSGSPCTPAGGQRETSGDLDCRKKKPCHETARPSSPGWLQTPAQPSRQGTVWLWGHPFGTGEPEMAPITGGPHLPPCFANRGHRTGPLTPWRAASEPKPRHVTSGAQGANEAPRQPTWFLVSCLWAGEVGFLPTSQQQGQPGELCIQQPPHNHPCPMGFVPHWDVLSQVPLVLRSHGTGTPKGSSRS